MTPTPEQEAIVAAVRGSDDNLCIEALAGAAKTTTLVMIANSKKSKPTLSLAFNKKIALEMADRLPGNCTAMTLNSLGYRSWSQALGKKFLSVNTKKNYEILFALCEKLKGEDKDSAYSYFSDILRSVAYGKTAGYIPDDHFPTMRRLMEDQDLFIHLEEEPSDLIFNLIRDTSIESLRLSHQGVVDFDDQILMSALSPQAKFPNYPLVLIDEAQDLSSLNHFMLRKLAKERVIGVGDACQSIYGFRGAHEDSMNLLKSSFNMRSLVLSVSFRCPRLVVEEARWRAPHMQYPEWAIEGSVSSLPSWTSSDLPQDATVLCRNNAPLFSLALRLLRNGRRVELVGNDIGKTLVKILKKIGPPDTPRSVVLDGIAEWQEAKLAKSRSPGSINDQAACLRVFCEGGETLGAIMRFAENLLAQTGPVKLMTIHKSKGLEFDHVFILNRDLINLKDPQDRNVLYVGQTRAKQSLTYIRLEDFNE